MTRTPPSGKTASRLGYTAAVLVLCTWLIGMGQASAPGEPWQARFGQDHPLVGQMWDVEAARLIDATTLVQRLTTGRFVLLGEKHDNPDHHRLQAWILGAVLDAGRRPAVGFEMFGVDDGPAIARYVAAHPTDVAGLAEVVHWHRSGWPDWGLYQPIAEIALRAKLPLVATNLSQATARALGQGNLSAADAALAARLGLDRPLAPNSQAAMAAEIREAHCHYASEAQVEAMITMQRARDAQMATSLAAAGQQDGAVLIAGAGHVRQDYGVPLHLANSAPGATVLSVAFLEVSQGALEPAAYAARFQGAKLPFDYVWFTPRVDDQDPCQHFEEQLKRLPKERP
jgi:uncharacterized iron-regulated protein